MLVKGKTLKNSFNKTHFLGTCWLTFFKEIIFCKSNSLWQINSSINIGTSGMNYWQKKEKKWFCSTFCLSVILSFCLSVFLSFYLPLTITVPSTMIKNSSPGSPCFMITCPSLKLTASRASATVKRSQWSRFSVKQKLD